MTEAEWLTCDDPVVMIQQAHGKISDRKLRLFACACARLSDLWQYRIHREAFEAVEKADGGRSGTEAENLLIDRSPYGLCEEFCLADRLGIPTKVQRANLLRDIIGNPYSYWPWGGTKPMPAWPEDFPWLTPTVLSLAQAAYDERNTDGTLDHERLVVLSDALEEAGCDNGDLLGHLRLTERPCSYGSNSGVPEALGIVCDECNGTGSVPVVHVRGCWAIDLLLGKD